MMHFISAPFPIVYIKYFSCVFWCLSECTLYVFSQECELNNIRVDDGKFLLGMQSVGSLFFSIGQYIPTV